MNQEVMKKIQKLKRGWNKEYLVCGTCGVSQVIGSDWWRAEELMNYHCNATSHNPFDVVFERRKK